MVLSAEGLQNPRVTRRDVARKAGVSVATVSHVMNGTPGKRISPPTRARVAAIAKDMGYRPQFVGKALVSGRTFMIGMLQPSPESLFYNLYQHIIHGLAIAMRDQDYHLLTLFRDPECAFCRVAEEGRVDGLFILQSDFAEQYVDAALATGVPVVALNWAPRHAACPAAHADHGACIRSVIDAFAARGCRTILEVNDGSSCHANASFAQAFRDVMPARVADDMSLMTVVPDMPHFDTQWRTLLSQGMRWDGIFVDGAHLGETIMTVGEEFGLVPGRDYHLVTSSCAAGEVSPSRREQLSFTQDPEEVGRAAWRVMRRCLEAGTGTSELVPYLRQELAPVYQTLAEGVEP